MCSQADELSLAHDSQNSKVLRRKAHFHSFCATEHFGTARRAARQKKPRRPRRKPIRVCDSLIENMFLLPWPATNVAFRFEWPCETLKGFRPAVFLSLSLLLPLLIRILVDAAAFFSRLPRFFSSSFLRRKFFFFSFLGPSTLFMFGLTHSSRLSRRHARVSASIEAIPSVRRLGIRDPAGNCWSKIEKVKDRCRDLGCSFEVRCQGPT